MRRSKQEKQEILTSKPGITFRSIFEKELSDELDNAGMDYKYENSIVTYVEPARVRKYIPDFELENKIIIEAKGLWTADDRKKISLVIEQNPGLDIRMLFQRNHPLNKGSKTRYSDWCEKRGIQYAIGNIPSTWLMMPKAKRQRRTAASPE